MVALYQNMGFKVRITFSFDAEADAELLRWLEQQPNQSLAVREGLTAYLSGEIRLIDAYQRIMDRLAELEAKLSADGAPAGDPAPAAPSAEPASITAALGRFKMGGS